jgi:hypothetical protein
MELGDVMLAGHQDAPVTVGPRGHRGLSALAGVEVLPGGSAARHTQA